LESAEIAAADQLRMVKRLQVLVKGKDNFEAKKVSLQGQAFSSGRERLDWRPRLRADAQVQAKRRAKSAIKIPVQITA
jgi:hypothetical protein